MGNAVYLGLPIPRLVDDLEFTQGTPTSGTIYTALDYVFNVRLRGVCVGVEWTVQPTPLQLYLDVDDITQLYSVANPVSLTWYYPKILPLASGSYELNATDTITYSAHYFDCHRLRVRAETTGGTVQILFVNVIYQQWG